MAETTKLPKGLIEAARTLDLDLARKVTTIVFRPFYENSNGERVDLNAFMLSGLHSVRVRSPQDFTAEQVAESSTWLADNGWTLPL